uniref:Uncharacterized protein n=1 Tax=Cebus imitator TaxID=2715852 RepID=A0A2K5PV68_CEBIM
MVCEWTQGSREEGMASGAGACVACSWDFLEPASHINILGDSYSNKDELHKGRRPWTNQSNKQKPEVLAAGEKPWGLRYPEGSVLQAERVIFEWEKHIQPPFYSFPVHVRRGHCNLQMQLSQLVAVSSGQQTSLL